MNRFLLLIVVWIALTSMWGCAQPAPVVMEETGPSDGVSLYSENCSPCHGRLSDTNKPGRRPARIKSAIRYNTGGMSFLSRLSDEDIANIADALTLVSPPEGAGGEELYTLYCDECHRPLGETDIKGKSVADIRAALSDEMCNTINLGFLGDNELAGIADALAAEPEATEPVEAEPEVSVYDGFELARFVTCEGISEREPVGAGAEFKSDTERVYAFIEARNVKRSVQVEFVWYLDGAEAGRDRIKVGKGERWRTYCFKFIEGKAGRWRVELQVPAYGPVSSAEFDVN